MKYIFLNLKRFDIPTVFGGVNHLAPIVCICCARPCQRRRTADQPPEALH